MFFIGKFLAPLPLQTGTLPLVFQGFAAVSNLGDNPPCSTLFIGNLGDAVSEAEFLGLFGSQPGFKQMKLVRGSRCVRGAENEGICCVLGMFLVPGVFFRLF